jgi:hypothetical protein
VVGAGVDVGGGLALPLPILSCQACDDLNCSSRALIPAGSYEWCQQEYDHDLVAHIDVREVHELEQGGKWHKRPKKVVDTRCI